MSTCNMEKIIIAILIILLALLFFAASFLPNNKNAGDGLYKVGVLTICDKYHDKTLCAGG